MKTHRLYPVEIFEFRFDPDGVDYIDLINSSNLERRPHTWVLNTELNLHHLEEWEPVVDFFHSCLGEIHSHFNYDWFEYSLLFSAQSSSVFLFSTFWCGPLFRSVQLVRDDAAIGGGTNCASWFAGHFHRLFHD